MTQQDSQQIIVIDKSRYYKNSILTVSVSPLSPFFFLLLLIYVMPEQITLYVAKVH